MALAHLAAHPPAPADPRTGLRRPPRPPPTHPDQRALPLAELEQADAVYGYSLILTNLDVSTPDKVAAVEHWHRHRTESRTSSATAGTAPRHLPSGHEEVNTAWTWGALARLRALPTSS
ncbi:MAG TPA: hypothetical protein VLJ59_03490 [Mycobacteriales bacterium]|nr:hypothetical protein [Mycobacteriales bacterium]